MPEGPPLHTLPYEELLERLRSLKRLRVVADEGTVSGHRTACFLAHSTPSSLGGGLFVQYYARLSKIAGNSSLTIRLHPIP